MWFDHDRYDEHLALIKSAIAYDFQDDMEVCVRFCMKYMTIPPLSLMNEMNIGWMGFVIRDLSGERDSAHIHFIYNHGFDDYREKYDTKDTIEFPLKGNTKLYTDIQECCQQIVDLYDI